MKQESLFIPLNISTYLHVKHLEGDPNGPIAFLLHGAIENGRIFYSLKGKGFGHFLARAGWDVYIADLRGRGQSFPPVNSEMWAGQSENILEDLPALLAEIQQHRPHAPIFWVAHSWGGVLLMSLLARCPQWLEGLRGIILFGSKRSVRAQTPEKWLKVDFFWKHAAFALIRRYGYLPARRFKIGADDESAKSHRQSVEWVRPGFWRDSEDRFDYAQALQQLNLPPMLYLAGKNDASLGHPADVRDFMQEVGAKHSDYWLLARAEGFRHDYGHIDMLTHPDCEEDHFVRILNWMGERIGN